MEEIRVTQRHFTIFTGLSRLWILVTSATSKSLLRKLNTPGGAADTVLCIFPHGPATGASAQEVLVCLKV